MDLRGQVRDSDSQMDPKLGDVCCLCGRKLYQESSMCCSTKASISSY